MFVNNVHQNLLVNKTFYITCALPYCNNYLHVGHIYSTFLPADILVRFLHDLNKKTHFISGGDIYGVGTIKKFFLNNKQSFSTIKKLSLRNALKFYLLDKKFLRDFLIDINTFKNTSNKIHQFFVNTYFKSLLKKKLIGSYNKLSYYCNYHKIFVDKHLIKKSNKKFVCGGCQNQLKKKLIKFYFLKTYFKKYNNLLQHTMFNKIGHDIIFTKQLLEIKKTHNTRAVLYKDISRPNTWGIPIIIDKKHSFYVWFEALQSYLSFSQNIKSSDVIIQFMGKDNVFFHTYFLSNIYNKKYYPTKINTQHFLKINGDKLSKSQNNNPFKHYLPSENFDVEYMRFYLGYINNLKKDADFSIKDFNDVIDNILIHKIYNSIYRIFCLYNNTIQNLEQQTLVFDNGLLENTEHAILNSNLNRLINLVMQQATILNQNINILEPWKQNINITQFYTQIIYIILVLNYFLPKKMSNIKTKFFYPNTKNQKHFISLKEYLLHNTKKLIDFTNLSDCRLQ